MAEHTREELEDHNVPKLKEIASDLEIEGYSSMRKAELVDAIMGAETASEVVERTHTTTQVRRHPTGETDDDGNPVIETVEVERTAVDRISPEGGTVHAGTVDAATVARRDARREAQADRPGRVRPTPASIDPRLVDARKAQREADAERNAPRPATEPPNRG